MKQETNYFRALPIVSILSLVALALASCRASQAASPYVWIEGETPSFINVTPDINGSGRPQLLSGGKWLTVHAEPGEVDKLIPAEGVLIHYAFEVEQSTRHAIWGRIGYEFARSPLEWRIDGGSWGKITPEDLTTDLTELSFFTEIGWRNFGQQNLSAGAHTLELRIPKQKNAKGENERLLFGLDAICLTSDRFHANGKFKPGQEWRDDRDKQAEKVVFQLPAKPADGAQVGVPLAGLWEVCRHDEDLPTKVAEPISSLPEHPFWRAIEVPGDKNSLREDLVFAHRIWYRTRVEVPESQKDRSFYLVFPQNNLNTTVYVNGVLCGFEKHPYVHFQIDVTKGIKPGVNEICVGIRDAWYGYSASPTDPMKLRRHFNTPLQFTHSGFQDLAYPVWNAFQSGILVAPTFVSAGRVYVSDVFCKPSIAKKSLELDVTVANSSSSAVAGDVICEAVNAKTGAVEKKFSALPFHLGSGTTAILHIAEPWANPKLWWPDEPNRYRLRTTVRLGQSDVDVAETPFGFREWGVDGKNFTLNGYAWHGWNMGIPGGSKDIWLENYRKLHQTQMRMSGASQGGNRPLFGMAPDEALDWCDQQGVVVRRCGPLDGEAIGYMAIENDPELKKLYKSEIKIELLNEWREQMAAQVRGERNHPSVQIWSIENEWLYINCINLYGGLMDQFEAEAVKTAEAVRSIDPTRPCMTDGGGAGKAQGMPVHGDHYVADPDLTRYPALAYEPNVTGGGRGRWTWDEKRPRYLGEDFFYTGNHPELSTIGGEAAFGGKMSTLPACGLMLQILQQGYRWAGYGAWDFYCGDGDADNSQWTYMAPRVVLCRQWDWTFASGQKVSRDLAVFNDSHDTDPIAVNMRLEVAGKQIIEGRRQFTVTPGQRAAFKLTLPMPVVDARQEGRLLLSLSVRGKEIWSDSKEVSVLPSVEAADRFGTLPAEGLCVVDPAGGVAAFLKDRSIPFKAVDDLASLPKSAKVLVVGKDALDAVESTSSRLAALASEGRAVIVLEQKNPLKYQALPAEIETAANLGRVAFAEDLEHPAFRGLAQTDFFTWAPDEILFRNAYAKPVRGAKSLVQCGKLLQNSGLVEVQAGKGVLLLSQLVIGEKLSHNPVAQTLLANLIRYGATYKQVFRPVTAVVSDRSQLAKVLDATGLQYANADDPLTALRTPGTIAVIEATPANLKTLADHLPAVQRFTEDGGFLLLNGLTPEGLASYNKIVGFEHMIRPFKRERVLFPAVRDPLTAGLTTGDVALYSSQRIFPWTEGNYVVSDEFSYVVDFDEVAPFGKSSFFAYDNIVNGFVNADGWPLIINFEMNKDGSPYAIPITLPKPQTISEFTWIGNTNYYPATKLNLIFDGDQSSKIAYDVAPSGDPQVLPVNPPRTARQITLEIAAWQEKPESRPLLGIDNLYLKAQRPAEFYRTVKPMLNIGGMIHYVRGSGGIVLCNLKFQPREEVPANAVKKQTILATLLRNLQAPFSGGRSVIAGANLEYHPIDLSKQANQYRDEKGWFGDRQFTFRDLPLGKQKFAGVPYDVYDFATSPVPTVVMLAGSGVPGKLPKQVTGIPVGRKADALFFLHAARIDRPMDDNEKKEKKRFELFHYVVHYADGSQTSAPVFSQIGVDHYRQDSPRALPEAQIAWTKPYEGTSSTAVAYSMQWNNPHPEKDIATLDVAIGPDSSRGVPAVLAVTAASAESR
ncbi:MAG: glycoside hydrolase family 2 TIM barrel-domain containing protein [Thermoguttaceae bacterium]